MTDTSLNSLSPRWGGKRIIFSPKYRDRRSKVRYNLFDGSISSNPPRKYRRTKGRRDLFDVSKHSDPYGSPRHVVDAVPSVVVIRCADPSPENE